FRATTSALLSSVGEMSCAGFPTRSPCLDPRSAGQRWFRSAPARRGTPARVRTGRAPTAGRRLPSPSSGSSGSTRRPTTTVHGGGKGRISAIATKSQAANAGGVVVRPVPKLNASIEALLSSNAPIHPWFLGSLDENDVLGYAGIPVNVNGSMPDFLFSLGAS